MILILCKFILLYFVSLLYNVKIREKKLCFIVYVIFYFKIKVYKILNMLIFLFRIRELIFNLFIKMLFIYLFFVNSSVIIYRFGLILRVVFSMY